MAGDRSLQFEDQLLARLHLADEVELDVVRLVKPGRPSALVLLKRAKGTIGRTAIRREFAAELRQALEEFERRELADGIPDAPPKAARPRAYSHRATTREELISKGIIRPEGSEGGSST